MPTGRDTPPNNEPAYTPGPWTIEEYGDDDCPALVIHKDSESRVCFMATPGSHGDPAKIEADARLIAAAPDLFAALKELNEAAGDDALDGADDDAHAAALDRLCAAHAMARAALAKASGEPT